MALGRYRRILEATALAAIYGIVLWRTTDRPVDWDERLFVNVARNIRELGVPLRTFEAETPIMFFDHTPGIVYVSALLGADLFWGRLATAIVGLAVVLVVARHAGFLAGLAVIATPLFNTYAWYLRMELWMALGLTVAVVLLAKRQWLAAGLAVAFAVAFKEVALGFLVVGLYVWWQAGFRNALRFGLPSLVVVSVWLAWAWSLAPGDLGLLAQRWLGSAVGDEEARYWGGPTWAIGLALILLPVLALLAGGLIRRRPRGLEFALLGYVGLAVAASFVMTTKEPRFLMGVVPVAAMVGGVLLRRAPERDEVDRAVVVRRAGVLGRHLELELDLRRGGDGDAGH